MPTVRPRYQVTETEDVADALDAAAVRWPGVPRSRLVPLALGEWVREHRPVARTSALKLLVGSLPGIGGLYDRRQDWPA